MPGFGVHTALVPGIDRFSGHVGAEWLLREFALGAGVLSSSRFGPLASPCTDGTVVGRPLRTASGSALLANARWGDQLLDERTAPCHHEPAAAAWLRDAQSEYASVPAFLELAAQLDGVGSPAALIARTLTAAAQEVVHTGLCTALAQRHGQRDVELDLPNAAPRAPLPGLGGLMRLATESWLDGCLNEGAAAALAAEAARTAHAGAAHSAQTQIARDEAEHAELAWSILRFAIERGGANVREAVRACADFELPRAHAAEEDESSAWAALGRVPRQRAQSLTELHARRARLRLERLLCAA